MIIIEGMDNTGKTTLVEKLSSLLGTNLLVRVRPQDNQEAVSQSINLMKPDASNYVYDRCHIIGELVYGHMLRGGSLLGDTSWHHLGMLCKISPLFIYCRPPKKYILQWGDREQMEGVIENSEKLLARYDYVMSAVRQYQEIFGGIFIQYDYSQDKLIIYKNNNRLEVTTIRPTVEQFLVDLYNQNLDRPLMDLSVDLSRTLKLIDDGEIDDE